MKKGANDYIEKLKSSIKVGDRVISLHEDVRGGTVTGLYTHVFTVKTPEGYTEAIAYRDLDRFLIKGVNL